MVQEDPSEARPFFYLVWMPVVFLVFAHLVGILSTFLTELRYFRMYGYGHAEYVLFSIEVVRVFLRSWYVTGWGYAIVPASMAAGIGVGWLMDRGMGSHEGSEGQ